MDDKNNLEEILKRVAVHMPPAIEKLRQEYFVLKPQFLEFAEKLTRTAEVVQKTVLPAIWENIPKLLAVMEGLTNFPDHIRPMVRALATRGWFLSSEMYLDDWSLLSQLCKEERFDEVDKWMSAWTEEHIDEIVVTSSIAFPKRGHILTQAATAHKSELFAVSVPAILAQVEGMCIERIGYKFFALKSGKPRTKDPIEKLITDTLTEVLFLPLCEPHGLTVSENLRVNYPDAPNRHEILHGLSTDYDTRTNSLKAFSLLAYFVTVVAEDERIKKFSLESQ